MMKQFVTQLRWQFLILHKNNLINISVGITVIYGLLFYAIKDLGDLSKLLTLLIYNDPALIGLLFVGLAFLVEKNQGISSALQVLPLNLHIQVFSRMVALSIIGLLCALGMAISVQLFDFNLVVFSLGVVCVCLIFSALGLWVLSYSSEFLIYLLKSIPILLLSSAPFLNYFGVTDSWWLNLSPISSSLHLIAHAFAPTLSFAEIALHIAISLAWFNLLYFFSFRTFKKRFLNAAAH